MARLQHPETQVDSLFCLQSYLQWSSLYEEVKKITGSTAAGRYAYAISKTADCTVCAALFRKEIIEAGSDPDKQVLDNHEKALVELGSSIARFNGNIADHVYNGVAKHYSQQQMRVLVAFAGLMIATNIFNNVVETEITEQLENYLPPVRSLWQ